MARVFIGIGSNQGDRLAHISRAAQALASLQETRVVQMAPILETAPVGGPPQEKFLNTVVELQTRLTPQELLGRLRGLERELGRTPSGPRWGPRVIDLDILCYDDLIVEEPSLTIPHPQLHLRRFVLEPLAQLAPELKHPLYGQSVADLLAQLPES